MIWINYIGACTPLLDSVEIFMFERQSAVPSNTIAFLVLINVADPIHVDKCMPYDPYSTCSIVIFEQTVFGQRATKDEKRKKNNAKMTLQIRCASRNYFPRKLWLRLTISSMRLNINLTVHTQNANEQSFGHRMRLWSILRLETGIAVVISDAGPTYSI